jgi:hypothetical protein
MYINIKIMDNKMGASFYVPISLELHQGQQVEVIADE